MDTHPSGLQRRRKDEKSLESTEVSNLQDRRKKDLETIASRKKRFDEALHASRDASEQLLADQKRKREEEQRRKNAEEERRRKLAAQVWISTLFSTLFKPSVNHVT